jgi:hypothetical protein
MNYNFASDHWRLPKNYPEIVESVEWAAEESLTLSVKAPLSVSAELVRQKVSGNWILHLINFDFTRPVDDIAVNLRLPAGRELKEAIAESPDGSVARVLEIAKKGDVAVMRVPGLRVYGIVRLAFENQGRRPR